MCSRSVAQPGSASALGAEGREFESRRSDHFPGIHVQGNHSKNSVTDAIKKAHQGLLCFSRVFTSARSSVG